MQTVDTRPFLPSHTAWELGHKQTFYLHVDQTHMAMFANNAMLGGGVRVRISIRE